MVVAPPKLFAPVSASVPAVALMRAPLAPEMTPELVPLLTVSVVVPSATVPPLSVPTEEVVPLRLALPAVSVPIVATPPTVSVPPLKVVTPAAPVTEVVPPVMEDEEREPALTVPLEIAAVSRPTAETAPPATPPVMVASLPKRVAPAPVSEVRVIVPVRPVKLRLFAVALALVTPARVRPVPEIVAKPVLSRASVAVL